MAGVPVLCEANLSEGKQTLVENNDLRLPLTGRALSADNRLLIPTLPILLDVFQLVNFNQRSGRVSNAPLDLRLLLHFTPSQLRETASNDAIISWLFDLLAESSFCRQMKALMIKVREHSEWIIKCRRRVRNLASKNEMLNIESTCTFIDNSNKLLPFWQFYVQHKQIRFNELNRLTESNKKEPMPNTDYNLSKRKTESDSSNSDSEHSDSSYDIDDGKTVTHVSKSKVKQKSKKEKTKKHEKKNDVNSKNEEPSKPTLNTDESDESDFDLEAALMDEDDKSVNNCDLDELPDFELEGVSTDEYSDEEDELSNDVDNDPENFEGNSDIEMTDLSKSLKISKKQQKAKTTKKKTNNHVVPKQLMKKSANSTEKPKKSKVINRTSIKTLKLTKSKQDFKKKKAETK
ncbi:nucleolar complex protein 2 [Schistosoma bovis]|uniref:Nucleolar complex protein 2 n=1 Tax=Schistosoma bovis TaxID=6184 RepID=A0A430QBY2_SCHBO|nr:nucleolar complex protein 2 [Schistosoma bovis]